MRIGLTELFVIAVIAIALLKPEKLPEYAKKFGAAMQRLKENTKVLSEVTEPVKDAVRPVTDIKDEITGQVEQMRTELTSTNSDTEREE